MAGQFQPRNEGEKIMKTKYIVIVSLLLCFIVLITSIYYINEKKSDAYELVMEYKTFLEDATEIQLRKSVDSNTCVRFSDEDLIEIWRNFFDSAKFTYIKKIDNTKQNGGQKTIDFISANNIFTFQFFEDNASYIIIDNHLFSVESNAVFPFDETYTIATKRNYTIDLTN